MAVLVFFAHTLCFWHGNKRNGLHLQSGQDIISIPAAKRQEFNEKMIRFYDSAEGAETMALIFRFQNRRKLE